MLRLLLALSAVAALAFGARLLMAVSISVIPRGFRLSLECGDTANLDYPGLQGTRVMVKVLETCEPTANISTFQPPSDETEGGWTPVQRWHNEAWVNPERGTTWLVSVPRDGKLKLDCAGEPATAGGCVFEVTAIPEGGRHHITVFETAQPVACGTSANPQIYNSSGTSQMIRIEWMSLCTDRDGQAIMPRVTIASVERPPTVADTLSRAKPRGRVNPGDPIGEWQRNVQSGRTLVVQCPAGQGGRCSYRIMLAVGYTNEIFNP